MGRLDREAEAMLGEEGEEGGGALKVRMAGNSVLCLALLSETVGHDIVLTTGDPSYLLLH